MRCLGEITTTICSLTGPIGPVTTTRFRDWLRDPHDYRHLGCHSWVSDTLIVRLRVRPESLPAFGYRGTAPPPGYRL